MSILAYLVRCYIYIAKIVCPSAFNRFKHKNSLELYPTTQSDYSHHEEIPCDSNDTVDNHLHTLNKNKPYKIPKIDVTYNCGYCNSVIRAPQFMYSDKTFCSLECRHAMLLLDKKKWAGDTNN